MNPVAFKIFGISIMWYGILIAFGVLIGALLALRQARRIGFREEDLIDVIMIGIPVAIIGARLYYVLFNLDFYKNNPGEIFNIRGGGLAIHGGIMAAVLAGAIFCKIRKVNFWQIADITAPSFIIAQGIGRWGNYINQEAYGVETNLPWGILIDGKTVHPTFLYESIWNFMVFFFLVWFRNRYHKFDGQIFALYIILYSIARFFIEGLRIDSLYLGNFRVAQLVSLALVITGIFLLRYLRKQKMD
ncbi:MAG TPA: prolipoprotein diacylglyceryl transferase [Clostridiales bacterium]|nr:prolipoprotein diacylglyceryl transferase [Clostridiales bacterium]